MKVVNWNVQWATPGSARSPEILCRIAGHSPDIVCLTETDRRLLSRLDGHLIVAGPAPGQEPTNNQRKVLLWSKRQWIEVDDVGSGGLPPGRFVAGTTDTPEGRVRVIGVCIPWHNSNVNVGAKDKTPWQDHSSYLDALSSTLAIRSPMPRIVMGDFNQQIGQRRRPYPPLSHPVRGELRETMQSGRSPGLTIATAGLGLRGRRAIDHIAISGELSAVSLTTIDNMDGNRRLSDHFGVVADLSTRDTPQNPL
ncbi:MAG: endonuclease/exonuclease/phosphatase family protein [Chloroflexota bacterium]|nr:endonuclease/exonuclease/phosphatase family protein [Chloroflexota bacterium]MDE2960361.1 endonuclease/exonuclease/phosphatase family protein [Chloroflexota bacterium]